MSILRLLLEPSARCAVRSPAYSATTTLSGRNVPDLYPDHHHEDPVHIWRYNLVGGVPIAIHMIWPSSGVFYRPRVHPAVRNDERLPPLWWTDLRHPSTLANWARAAAKFVQRGSCVLRH